MPKDPGGDAATKKRKENNYRAKKQSKSADVKEPHCLENLGVGLPTHPVTESQKPTHGCTPPCDVQQPGIKPLPTPLDASIPFKTQFGIVTAVQGWLEEAIFEFFRKWLPEVLEAKDIDVPEKVELTDWADIIGKELKALPKAATDRIPGTSLMQELRATYQLRNAALKRQTLSSIRLLELLGAASNLVTIMKDEKKIALIEALVGEIQAGSRILETRLEAAKVAIIHDSNILESMKNMLAEQLVQVNKAAGARCERNRKGVGITLDLFLDNTRKGSTRGGQMAILEDELLRLQESQETFLPQDFQSRYSNFSQTGSMQISRSAKRSEEDRENDGIKGGKEGVAIASSSLSHAADGKAQVQGAFSADASSTDTSSASNALGHAEDGWETFKKHPKAILLAQNMTSKFNSSASPMQPGSNGLFPFMASNSKSRNPDKNQPGAIMDLVGRDAMFDFNIDPHKSTANAASNLSTDRSTEMEPIFTRPPPPSGPFAPTTNPVPALSSTQPLFGRENAQATNPAPSELAVANTTANAIGPSPAGSSWSSHPIKKADSMKGDQEQVSSSLSSLFATALIDPTSKISTSSKEEQAAASPTLTPQPQSATIQPSPNCNKSPPTTSASLPQAPPPSGLEIPPVNPFSAPSTHNFKFVRPTISQTTRCFGTAESLPFNPLYLMERETWVGGRNTDRMLSTQSITFMMGHRNYSFEVCHIAVYA